jgi:hypothetical protein
LFQEIDGMHAECFSQCETRPTLRKVQIGVCSIASNPPPQKILKNTALLIAGINKSNGSEQQGMMTDEKICSPLSGFGSYLLGDVKRDEDATNLRRWVANL